MQVTLENEKENVVKLEITVPAKDAAEAYNSAVKKVSQLVNIDGFRKGKAPRNIVERHVGVDKIKQTALEDLLPGVLNKAIDDNKLDVITQPYITSYDYNLGEDLKVTAKVETRPEVTLGEYKGLKVEVEAASAEANSMDKALDLLRNQHAETKIVTDRETKETDVVKIDFEGSVNGEKIKGGNGNNYQLDLAHSDFIPGFASQLAGKKLNDEFDIDVTFPEDYHDESLKGKKAVFKIKIKEISEKIIPELTEQFVQKVSPFKTIEELKADIQKYIDKSIENTNTKNAKNMIFKKAIQNASVVIPQTMIEREVKSLAAEYKNRLAAQGLTWEMAVNSQGEEELLKSIHEDAALRIKNSLVIDKIAKVENLHLDKTDLDKKVNELSILYKIPRRDFYKQISKEPKFFASITQQAMNDKVREFLLQNNEVTFTAPKEKKEEVEEK